MKVLVADDDMLSRRMLQGCLEAWGHEVVAAADGAAAWEQFEAGDFPFVLTDWMMPRLDGLELTRRIRAAARSGYVFVVLLSARSQKEDVIAGMEAGADDFLTKPFDPEELRVRLRAGERVIRLERTLADQNRSLREAQAALVQSEKLASLGQLAAGMAHEINNPVAYVANNLAVLQRDMNDLLAMLDRYRSAAEDPARLEEARKLEEQCDLEYLRAAGDRQFRSSAEGLRRVRDIVRNLCDFARLDEADFAEVDLNACLRATVAMIDHELRQRELDLKLDLDELPTVSCYPNKLNQVFLHLLRNAMQASAAGSAVEVRTRRRGDGVTVEVEDHGSGIAPEHLPHIFEPFFTTRPVGEGTGLGLAVSYGIVRDHGGDIMASSTPGQGSTFRIRLPRTPPR